MSNKNIDFFIITDQLVQEVSSEGNIKVINMSFKNLQDRVNLLYDFNNQLSNSYKINDYKPAFGEIFKMELSDYEWWGFTDIDLIFGNLGKFITDEMLSKYDKINVRGHLQLFRNKKEINTAYRSLEKIPHVFNYRKSYSTNLPTHFDEMWGISEIFKKEKFKQYDPYSQIVQYADVSPKQFSFKSLDVEGGNQPHIFYWNNGILKMIFVDKRKLQEREIEYVHLQKRSMEFSSDFNFEEPFYIRPNTFFNYKGAINEKMILEWNRGHWDGGNIKHLFKYYFNQIKIGEVNARLMRLL